MTHRIIEVKALENFVVSAIFQDGTEKRYRIDQLFAEHKEFQIFQTRTELFGQVTVDVGGYGICWNDDLDLSAEEIWNNGELIEKKHEVDIFSSLAFHLTQAREVAGLTQKELAKKTNIYQADISKIERGIANPSVKTMERLAKGLGMKLKIEFVKDDL